MRIYCTSMRREQWAGPGSAIGKKKDSALKINYSSLENLHDSLSSPLLLPPLSTHPPCIDGTIPGDGKCVIVTTHNGVSHRCGPRGYLCRLQARLSVTQTKLYRVKGGGGGTKVNAG